MKKRIEFCVICNSLQPHKDKKKSWKKGGKDSSHGTYPLPLKCMTCGYQKGLFIRQKTERSKHVRI